MRRTSRDLHNGRSVGGYASIVITRVLIVLATTAAASLSLSSQPSGAEELGPVWFRVAEESHPGTMVGDVLSQVNLQHLLQQDVHAALRLTIISVQPRTAEGIFSVDSLTGTLSIAARLDREALCRSSTSSFSSTASSAKCSVRLDVAVKEAVGQLYIVRIYIEVTDINDHAPAFPTYRISMEMQENSPPGTALSPPLAVDQDAGVNGLSHYELQGSGLFELQQKVTRDSPPEPKIVLKSRLDKEEGAHHQLRLIAYDGGGDKQQSGALIIDLRVIDINDNAPRFANDSYNFAIHENMAAGTKLGQVKATDPDEGRNGVVVYKLSHLSSADYGAMFAVDNTTGMVSLKAMLDYEKEATYVIYVMALDKGDVSLTSDVAVTVTVIDVNDNPPYVVVKHMSLLDYAVVAEGTPAGATLSYVAVSDVDSGRGGHVTCHVDDKQRFALHRTATGDYKLVTAEEFDYEMSPSYRVSLSCRDHGLPTLITRVEVMVRIEDRNDYAPVFDQRTYAVTLSESTVVDSEILHVHAFDNDTGSSGKLTYFLDAAASNALHVDPETGVIRTKIELDFETAELLECFVMVSDEGEPRFTATATILLRLLNVDDEKPTFVNKRYNFNIMENLPSGSLVGTVVALDRDLAPFNALTYAFTEHSRNADLFSIDANSGQIRTRASLDRERYSVPLSLTILASSVHRDSGRLLSDVAIATVEIDDANDNCPVFESPRTNNLTIAVSPAYPAGSIVTRLFVADADQGDNARITFTIAANLAATDLFYVESDSALIGSLRLKRSLATFEGASFSLTIVARDNGLPSLNVTLSLVVRVTADAALREDDEYAALSAARNSAMRTLMLCIVFVSVPIVVATVILLFICCLRKRFGKPARTVVVVKATNGKATNGHVTSCYDKVATSLADENTYHQMTSDHHKQRELQSCNGSYARERNSFEMKHKPDDCSVLVPSSELSWNHQLTSTATVHTHNGSNGNGHDKASNGNGNGNGNHKGINGSYSNGTLPSFSSKKYQSAELANGSLKYNRTSSLSTINGHNGGSPLAERTRLLTPPARSTNGSVEKPVTGSPAANGNMGNGTVAFRTVTKSYDMLNESSGTDGGSEGKGKIVSHDYGCVTKGIVSFHKNGTVGRKTTASACREVTSFRHHHHFHQQPYVNSSVVTSSHIHPASLSSDDDVYETVETPV